MRIALVNSTYWPEVRRGTERVVHDVGVGLTAAGHDVTVLTSHRSRTRTLREDGMTVARSYRPPDFLTNRNAYETHLANVPTHMWRLARGGFDVAHAFFPSDAWAAVRARRFGGPPVVFSIHGIPTRKYLVARRYRLSMLEEVLAGAAVVTVLSRAAAEPIERYLAYTPAILPAGIYVADFQVDAVREPRPTLVCAASLNDPRKRRELLLRAFERVRAQLPDARLLLAGRRDPVLNESDTALPEGVERIEADRREQLAQAYASSWASVLPSVEEAFGLVSIESLAAGTPAVAARSGASPDVVDDSVGRLFEPDDEDDLARAMLEAMRMHDEPGVADRCRERAAAYDWTNVLPAYEELYLEAVAATRPVAV